MDKAQTLDGRIRAKAMADYKRKLNEWKSFIYDGSIFANEPTKLEANPRRQPEEKIVYHTLGELLDAIVETKFRVTGSKVAQDAVDKFISDFDELSNRIGDLETSPR